MKVLIIGFGSIGRRHFGILKSMKGIDSIEIVTQQNIENISTYPDLKSIENLDVYDYFIIASETVKHFGQLKEICSKISGKKILVEKPLYDKKYEVLQCRNDIYIAYNLRFHPVIDKLKSLLEHDKVYYVNVICGQYLPTWRPDQDYRESYSSDISRGGGVLRDLSHEIDYVTWLFGEISQLDTIRTKISDLEISSDDIFTAIGITVNKSIINLSMDYISKVPIRRLVIHTEKSTIEADVINNSIAVYNKDSGKNSVETGSADRDYTYTEMHKAIMDERREPLCSFEEGLKVIDLIEKIEFKKV